jgi:hypothetical protein
MGEMGRRAYVDLADVEDFAVADETLFEVLLHSRP